MTLTPASLRVDAPGRACGQSHIAAGKTCQKKGAFPTKKAIAAGLGVTALGVGALALSRRGARPMGTRSPGAATPSASAPTTPPGPPRLPGGLTPRALLSAAPPRKSKTQRMRENTAAAAQEAERAVGRAAQAEITRAGAVANAMASTGEATGMAFKTAARELRLRTEAARRRYEPGYRANPSTSRRAPQGQLPESGLGDVPFSPEAAQPPSRDVVPLDPRTGQPRRRRARGFGRTDGPSVVFYAPRLVDPAAARRDAGPLTPLRSI